MLTIASSELLVPRCLLYYIKYLSLFKNILNKEKSSKTIDSSSRRVIFREYAFQSPLE